MGGRLTICGYILARSLFGTFGLEDERAKKNPDPAGRATQLNLRIPTKPNADSGGKPDGIPG